MFESWLDGRREGRGDVLETRVETMKAWAAQLVVGQAGMGGGCWMLGGGYSADLVLWEFSCLVGWRQWRDPKEKLM